METLKATPLEYFRGYMSNQATLCCTFEEPQRGAACISI